MKLRSGVLVAGLIAVLGAALVFVALNRIGDSEEPHASYSKGQLSTSWPGAQRNPLLVPEQLPAATGGDEVAFFLSSAMTADGRRAGRTWVTTYVSDSLDPGGSGVFRVYQDQLDPQRPERRRCAGSAGSIVREVARNRVSVCLDSTATEAARSYWGSVPLSSDYEAVSWIPAETS